MINGSALLIAVFVGLFLFTFIILIITIMQKTDNDNDWIFHNFSEKLYDILYEGEDPGNVAAKLGLKLEKYNDNCKIVKTAPKTKKVIMYALYGIVVLVISSVAAIFTKGNMRIVIFAYYHNLYNYNTSRHHCQSVEKSTLPAKINRALKQALLSLPLYFL